jgi:membrane-associated protease RseP (regulator of RpoE activity)
MFTQEENIMTDKKISRHTAVVISLVVLLTLGAAACETTDMSNRVKPDPWPGMDVAAARDVAINESGRVVVADGKADAKGVIVTRVQDYTAAHLLGLKAGDIITSMNEAPVRDVAEYHRVLRELCGDGFWVTYTRKGQNFETIWINRTR